MMMHWQLPADVEVGECVAKKMDVGDFVIVDYEGIKYPGVLVKLKKSGAEVSTMVQSGKNWKWPSK